MKKVIFIGGTAYSGSTFLDMILANSPQGFSCGEVYALFNPFRKHHIDYKCGCGDPHCKVWETVKEAGAANLYQRIFEIFPNLEFIVDSSKDPLWISDRIKDLTDSGIRVRNILIWKSPEEFYFSRTKRNQKRGWKRSWINYHKLYFRNVDQWIAVSYKNFATFPDVLERICKRLEIPFFEGKQNYWEKKHHTLFGNTSAKIHLYDSQSESFKNCKAELNSTISQLDSNNGQCNVYREIYYEAPIQVNGENRSFNQDPRIEGILKILLAADVSSDEDPDCTMSIKPMLDDMRATKLFELYHRAKRQIRSLLVNIYGKLK